MRYFVIRTENLTRHYGRRRGIENLNIEVEPGEVFGFLGPAGSGKTTTIRLLLDYEHPNHGNAIVLGMDSHRQSREIRKQVGFLPYDYAAQAHWTVQDYLRRSSNVERASWLAGCFGLDLRQRLLLMSPSDRRKLGLVRAFAASLDLYLLDEPTRGLNRDELETFFRLVSEARAEGRSIFFASKNLQEMERACDKVGIIRHGKLIAVERGWQLRSRAIRRIELRFADPVRIDEFRKLPNVDEVRLEDNRLYCRLHGEPDALIKAASQHRVTDFISQQISLEESLRTYYELDEDAN